MVEVEQQAFAAVEESEAEDVVVNKRGGRAGGDIDHAEAAVSLDDRHLGSQRRIAVHVLDIVGKIRVGVMDERMRKLVRRPAEGNIFVHRADFEGSGSAAKEAELAVGIEASVAGPASEKEILARDHVSESEAVVRNASDVMRVNDFPQAGEGLGQCPGGTARR